MCTLDCMSRSCVVLCGIGSCIAPGPCTAMPAVRQGHVITRAVLSSAVAAVQVLGSVVGNGQSDPAQLHGCCQARIA
jgi:hypothetical protein